MTHRKWLALLGKSNDVDKSMKALVRMEPWERGGARGEWRGQGRAREQQM